MQTDLHSNLEALRERIAEAARRAGRDPGAIELVAVTKSVSPDVAGALARLCPGTLAGLSTGALALGENRIGELERKAAWFAEHGLAARWHFIGRLQRNKVRRVVGLASAIHSVDGEKLLDAIEHAAGELGRRPELFLQVKLSDDEKGGSAPQDVARLVERARALRHARLVGLMTMAPLAVAAPAAAADAARGRPPAAVRTFERLAALARELDAQAFAGGRARLSMGMSSDLEAAIDAGADVVRVGGALFEGLRSEAAP